MENIDEPLFTGVLADLLKLTDSAWLPTGSERGNMQGSTESHIFPGCPHTMFMSFKLQAAFLPFSDNYNRTFIDCLLLEKYKCFPDNRCFSLFHASSGVVFGW